jgi:hypothetical protein
MIMPAADQVAPRRPNLAARLAWLACGLALALLLAGLILLLSSPDGTLPEGYLSRRQQMLSLVGPLGPLLLGGLIAARRPSNPYGWLWSAYALGWALVGFNEAYVTYVSASGVGMLRWLTPVAWWAVSRSRACSGSPRSSCCCSRTVGHRLDAGAGWSG